jgi:hypothetical protein
VYGQVSKAASELSPDQLAPVIHVAIMLCQESVPASGILLAATSSALIAGAAHRMSTSDMAQLLVITKDFDCTLSSPLSTSLLRAVPSMSCEELQSTVLLRLWVSFRVAL